jgi:HEAT repeats
LSAPPHRRRRLAAAGAAVSLLLGGAAADERPRASGGVRLVEALEGAPIAVVAVVAEPQQIDAHGFAARLSVESSLVGPAPAGAALRIAWEELASSRAPRFAEGDRVLIALEPLPGASIWATRFPDPSLRSRIFGVSMRGEAFLRSPSPLAVGRLEHYLRLAANDREGANGVALLAEIAAACEPPLALAAVDRLARHSELDEKLDPASAALLVRALLRTDTQPALSTALLELVARQRPPALRPPLEALAAREALAPAVVFEALAALDSGVAPARAKRLLADPSPAHREVAARHASGPEARMELARLARSDPAPSVRAAAIERLVALGGDSALEDGLSALHDPDAGVRGAAVRALGSLGASAVPGLRGKVDSNDPEAARAAVVALQLTGSSEATAALVEIAESHRDEGVRALAAIALGRQVGHVHN